jgi:hypothetical protein
MATRKKNAAFTGSPRSDVDTGAPTFKRIVENAAGDTALVHDKATGQNSHTAADTLLHNGTAGTGSLLGYPVVNQGIFRDLRYEGSTVTGGSKDAGFGIMYLMAVPFWLPSGETEVQVTIHGSQELAQLGPMLSIGTTGLANAGHAARVPFQAGFAPIGGGDLGLNAYRATVRELTGGQLLLIVVYVNSDAFDVGGSAGTTDSVRLDSWSVTYGEHRIRRQIGGGSPSDQTWPITSPSATEGVAHVDLWAEEFVDNEAINGRITAGTNRNQNGLYEYITGYPAGGNVVYTQADHNGGGSADDVNPDRSRFLAHTRSLYAAEPLIEMPIVCEALGGFHVTGHHLTNVTGGNTEGIFGWRPPNGTTASSTTVHYCPAAMPDFPAAAGSTSNLKWAVIAGIGASYTAGIGNWRMTMTNATDTDQGTFVRIGTSFLAIASGGTTWGFAPDAVQTQSLVLDKTTAFTADDEIAILGYCIYYDP